MTSTSTNRVASALPRTAIPGQPRPSRCCVWTPPAAWTGRSTRRSSPSCAPPCTGSFLQLAGYGATSGQVGALTAAAARFFALPLQRLRLDNRLSPHPI